METKAWYQSKAIIGSIVTVIGVILGALGYTFGVEDQAAFTEIVSTVLGVGGSLLAIYGRVRASKQIK